MQFLAAKTGYSVDGILFLSDAFTFALRNRTLLRRKVGAFEVCLGVREWAMSYFNDADEAKELLSEWGVRSSEDVGRIIFAMVEVGLARAQTDDRIEQFDELFTLDDLFTQDWAERARQRG
jgi:uncharacterized repeat protein (TIGR04138 family)